jgi:hypothetical protein
VFLTRSIRGLASRSGFVGDADRAYHYCKPFFRGDYPRFTSSRRQKVYVDPTAMTGVATTPANNPKIEVREQSRMGESREKRLPREGEVRWDGGE